MALLTDRARECTGRPLLIAVDAEGGRVMRLGPSAGYTATLSHQDLGDANDLAQTELEARRIGTMLREAGINWNLAPVVDVGYNPANPVIVGVGRSFGANPALVAALQRRGKRVTVASTLATPTPMISDELRRQADFFLDIAELAKTVGRAPAAERAPATERAAAVDRTTMVTETQGD